MLKDGCVKAHLAHIFLFEKKRKCIFIWIFYAKYIKSFNVIVRIVSIRALVFIFQFVSATLISLIETAASRIWNT